VITVDTVPGPPGPPTAERMTAIEELDYLLDRPDEPNLVLMETRCHGHLDRDGLAEAVRVAFAADAGARRRLAAVPRWGRHPYWRPAIPPSAATPLTVVSWRTPAELAALRERLFAWPIALADAAVRVTLAVGPEYDVVILQIHHTSGDGIASLRLFRSVADAYRARALPLHAVPAPPDPPASPAPPNSPAPPALPAPSALLAPSAPPDPSTPARARTPRPRPGPRGPSWPGSVTRIARQGGQPGRPGYGFILVSEPVARPAVLAAGPQPTVNDLLVAAVCLAIDRWNAAQGRASGQISVTIPVNGRPPARRWQGDGNRSWLTRVVTTPADRADPARLLGRVTAQTRAAKERGRSGVDAMSRGLATGWAPVGVKRRAARLVRSLTAPVLTDTTVVSNLGLLPDPPSFDGSGTEPMWLAPPCPMPRGLSVGAATVAGQLHLSVRYRLALLDRAAAGDFMAGFRACLRELARPEPETAPATAPATGPEGSARS